MWSLKPNEKLKINQDRRDFVLAQNKFSAKSLARDSVQVDLVPMLFCYEFSILVFFFDAEVHCFSL